MGLFSKKDEVPELPRVTTLPRLPETQFKPQSLPSIPTGRSLGIGDALVKSAVTDLEEDHYHMQPNMTLPSVPTNLEAEHKKEVYVKLDKFKHAQKTFEEVKEKLQEIESLINKSKQLNEREKNELVSWSEELNNIKSKINEIDSEVFNQV